MTSINVGFWNVDNLFDTVESMIGSNTEFLPSRGWNDNVKQKKIENLSFVVKSMHDDQGPDILGLCEIENENLVLRVLEKLNKSDKYSIAPYLHSPDVRGIDVCLIYSKELLKVNSVRNYSVNLRYPTRDVFVVNFTVKKNNLDLSVIINHWPSRGGGRYETEPFRISAAENCAKAVDDILKLNIEQLSKLPRELKKDRKSLEVLDEKWNRNILVMGDFNDTPYDKSILNYLRATQNKEKLLNWKDIFDHPIQRKWPTNRQTDKHNYLFYQSYLLNCMWPLIPDGTIFHEDGLDMFDQFIVSKGLLEGNKNLEIDLKNTKINKLTQMDKNLPESAFDVSDRSKIHPLYKKAPMRFEYQKIRPNGEPEMLFPGRNALTGYSDHFPIESVINCI